MTLNTFGSFPSKEELAKKLASFSAKTQWKTHEAVLDSLSIYNREVKKIPLLQRDEQYKLLIRAKRWDEKARQKLIESNTKLVLKIAGKYHNVGDSFMEDLVQEGNLWLMHAILRYDPDKRLEDQSKDEGEEGIEEMSVEDESWDAEWSTYNHIKLSTYATFWINKYIREYVIKHGRNTRLPHDVFLRMNRVERAKYSTESERFGEFVPASEIARVANLEVDEVMKTARRVRSEVSLYAPIGSEDGLTIADSIACEEEKTVEELVRLGQFQELVEDMFAHGGLKPMEAFVLRDRCFNAEDPSFEVIGKKVDRTWQMMRKYYASACAKALKYFNGIWVNAEAL